MATCCREFRHTRHSYIDYIATSQHADIEELRMPDFKNGEGQAVTGPSFENLEILQPHLF